MCVFLFFTLLADRASTIPSNILRGCQSGTWSAELENIRGTFTKLQSEHSNKNKAKTTRINENNQITINNNKQLPGRMQRCAGNPYRLNERLAHARSTRTQHEEGHSRIYIYRQPRAIRYPPGSQLPRICTQRHNI